jgi:predicted enzyme related to lactoylglutathione lyase
VSRVVHFELHAEDPDRAIRFYKTLFDWDFTRWSGPQEYWLIKTGPDSQPGINGGLIRRRGVIDGTAVIGYVCTVNVESVDALAAAIPKEGGTIVVPKMAIPGIGWLAYAKDTEGNIFGVMHSDAAAK